MTATQQQSAVKVLRPSLVGGAKWVRSVLCRASICAAGLGIAGGVAAGTFSGFDPVGGETEPAIAAKSVALGGLDPVNGLGGAMGGTLGGTLGGVDPKEPLSGTTSGFDPDYRRVVVGDENSMPFLKTRGREDYRTWLSWVAPKAFAIAENGAWYGAQGAISTDVTIPADPSQRALMLCEKRAKQACKLYAVDRRVVWGQDLPVLAPAKK